MRVQDVMTTDVSTIGPDALLKDAAIAFVERRISGMPVVSSDGQLLGVISETDILPKESGEQRGGGGFMRWLVDPEGLLVGLVSRGDLIRAFARPDEEIRREIQDDVIHGAMWIDPKALDVTVTSGIVTLNGEVASEADAELLPTFARKVIGVVDVHSTLTYRS